MPKLQVEKITVFKVGDDLCQSRDLATQKARECIIREVMEEDPASNYQDEAEWMARNWDRVEREVKAAFTGV